MITLLKIFPEKWEQAKGFLRLDLEAIEAAMNQRWSVTFGANNLLNPDTIQGWESTQTRYISNEATSPTSGWPMWAQVNLANGVKNRLPFSNLVAATLPSVLAGRGSTAAGNFEEITLGPGLAMHGTSLDVDLTRLQGSVPIPDEPYREDPWPLFGPTTAIVYAFTAGSVIFAGATGDLAQDNSGLFFDAANNRLGVGVASPADAVDVRAVAPIVGMRFSDNTQFASLRFTEVSTLASTVQHIGSAFTEVARRNNLEFYNLTASGSITLHTANNSTARVTISSAGVVSMTGLLDLSAAAAGQIKFPASQNASADANTLDDYEEGTWTPTVTADGGSSGQTYADQIGRYIKIGRMVYAGFTVTLSAKGTLTGNVQIGGLPFAVLTLAGFSVATSYCQFDNLSVNWITMVGIPSQSSSKAYLRGIKAAGISNQALFASADLSNTTQIFSIFAYFAQD